MTAVFVLFSCVLGVLVTIRTVLRQMLHPSKYACFLLIFRLYTVSSISYIVYMAAGPDPVFSLPEISPTGNNGPSPAGGIL